MSELVGKTVIVEVTSFDGAGTKVDFFDLVGRVEQVGELSIGIRREGWSELFSLPPAPDLFEPAPPGARTLRSTGETVDDPDYLVDLHVTINDLDSLLALRGLGFPPAGA